VKSEFIEISDELFSQVGKMITEKYGIKMPPEKKIMFQARLQRRLHELDIHSFDEYAERLLNDKDKSGEFNQLADLISTNKTEFFREKEHFSFLNSTILPEFLRTKYPHQPAQFKVWSAGCSSGQEAYSIGIQIEEFRRISGVRFDYSILGTDISSRMLRQAREAIYPFAQVDELTTEIKHRYFLKSKDTGKMKVRIIKEIRDKVTVGYMNLMEDLYPFHAQFDVVFLRNTLIYFDRNTQMKVLKQVLNSLKSGGFLLIGHSESLINLHLPIQSVAPSIYVKTNG
jgi:chemotaxis protein methyltransferase CheR